jgi:ABC-2 type transport system permease protein
MGSFFSNIWKSIIRTFAFVRKEIFSVLRQPQLFLILVLGPFLILLIFGIGYRNEARALRTLFVVQPGSPLSAQIDEYATTLGPKLVYMGILDNTEAALQQLRRGEVDLVAVAPIDALKSIQANQQAEFTLYHREIDPLQVGYVEYFGNIYISEVNRRVLRAITTQGQSDAEVLQQDIQAAKNDAGAARQALSAGDELAARQSLALLSNDMSQISLAVGASLAVLSSVEETMGSEESQQMVEVRNLLGNIQQLTGEMQGNNVTEENATLYEPKIAEIETDLTKLESQLQTFTQLDPDVIITPFTSKVRSIAETQTDPVGFYAPAVLALLLSHLAVTTAALSIVQESNYGTLELFRVAPLAAGETLVGKYFSFMIFGAVVAAVLTWLLHYVQGVPMLGNWSYYALVIGVLLFTSLGIGFFISLLASSDTQAVQYTMIVLLTSVFFTGFMMRLDMLWQPVQVLSWSLPTTYGIVLLREIALRGNLPDVRLLGGLALIGVFFCALAWILLRRKITRPR